jgi:hypothetical protein
LMKKSTVDPQSLFDRLTRSLQLIASDFCTLKRVYPDFASLGDDLVLGFRDASRHMKKLVEHRLISDKHRKRLGEIKQYIDRLRKNGKAHSWLKEEFVKSSPEWSEMKEKAFLCLQELGFGYDEINLDCSGAIYSEDCEESRYEDS